MVLQNIKIKYWVASFLSVSEATELDEYLQKHNPVMACGWIKRGVEFTIQSNTGRQRLNVNGAVNIDSLDTVCRFYDTINGEATIDLCKAIEERYPKAGTIYIICDNATANQSGTIFVYKITIVFNGDT
ncbi:transposase [methane-oxidizing endosymbiont of Gigantopelta aegis]|uniref:transposase n=1 Tax=methane-oxidizing endosymbiont of Gigantopelta aegis TaxID=2794938 RepID=UPI0018DC8057|nr:transposase [methane-oxidizing endosymbiont of Gigantopelta aegis]